VTLVAVVVLARQMRRIEQTWPHRSRRRDPRAQANAPGRL
jgi:hypothetical protein